MTFSQGDAVTIIKLHKTGTITSVLGKGRYSVSLGKIQITCTEADLRKLERTTKKKINAVPAGASVPKGRRKDKLFKAELDLHGRSVSEALEVTAQFLSDAILAGHSEVHIIHGIGTGKLKNAIHQYLQSEAAVKSFCLHDFNPGTTRIFLTRS